MKFKKLLLVAYSGNELDEAHWNKLNEFCEEKVLAKKEDPKFKEHLKDADALLVKLGSTVDKDLIQQAPNLKYIGMLGTGCGRIDTEFAASKNITVCNIQDYATEAVAELAIAVILEHIRELERGKIQVKDGDNSDETFFGVFEIKNKKFGIIGLGNIGTRIAEIASKGFGAKVCYWNRTRKDGLGFEYKELDELLSDCDFISLNLASTDDTNNILNPERINKIKPGAIVINLAPMELVDINALSERLGKGDITFILDHSDEPSKEGLDKLSKYKNCIIYPPFGYTTKEATNKKQDIFVSNLKNFLNGTPTNTVN